MSHTIVDKWQINLTYYVLKSRQTTLLNSKKQFIILIQQFSSLALIGNELYDSQKQVIGRIKDLVGNLSEGFVEYIIITEAITPERKNFSQIYAIPAHFFRLLIEDDALIFSPKFTQKAVSVNVKSLPDHYHDLSVQGVDAFMRLLQSKKSTNI